MTGRGLNFDKMKLAIGIRLGIFHIGSAAVSKVLIPPQP